MQAHEETPWENNIHKGDEEDMRSRIVGEDRHSTIIDGGGTGSVINVTANNVDINGFTIQNSGSTSSDSGIYAISSGNNISPTQ